MGQTGHHNSSCCFDVCCVTLICSVSADAHKRDSHQPCVSSSSSSTPPPLCVYQQAQALLQQLERRKLYKWVSEITPPTGQRCATDSLGLQSAAEQIVGYQSTADTGVGVCRVVVCWLSCTKLSRLPMVSPWDVQVHRQRQQVALCMMLLSIIYIYMFCVSRMDKSVH